MKIAYAVRTDKGLRRNINEDAYFIERPSLDASGNDGDALLCGIADGMGGHACGEVAARMACDEFSGFSDRIFAQDPAIMAKRLKQKFYHIDNTVRNHGFRHASCMDMGTTLTALFLQQETAVMAHVGDSRIYRFKNRKTRILTTDHSLVQDLVREGIITAEAALTHPFRNKLTQVVGTSEPLEQVETHYLDIAAGDRFLLSTDGLHGYVNQQEIEKILFISASPKEAAEQLISLALQQGGEDNITVIVIFIE